MKYNCVVCKIEFFKKGRKPRKYCSKKCQSAAGRKEIICPECNKSISVISSSNQIFCSNQCAALGKKSNIVALKITMMKKYGVEAASQLPDFKLKVKNTLIKHYGNNPYQVIGKKCTDTMMKKYGVSRYVNVDKIKKTKEQRYGSGTYNNRKKFLDTMTTKYGSHITQKSLARIQRDSANGTIGFKSEKYKEYLKNNGISNISQLPSVKNKKVLNVLATKYEQLTSFPFNTKFKVLFSLEEYMGSNNYKTYPFECLTCHSTFMGYVTNGGFPRCKVCNPLMAHGSNFQREVITFVKTLVPDIQENNHSVIFPLELDIYIPSKKLAIECNGVYWHSELQGKGRNYHLSKTNECNAAGIELIHIWDNEWVTQQPIIKSILQNKLASHLNTKIYARKCELKEITAHEGNAFFDANHLQGSAKASIWIGLYHNDELVQLLAFSKSRYSKQQEWEIIRSVTRCNHTVVGGLERLWKYFVKTYNPQSVVTYADRRFFTGNSYKNIGFAFAKNTTPNYMYFKLPSILESRQKYQKHKLSKILPIIDKSLSEWTNMKNNGFDRIWDCGHQKYVWERK